MSEFDESTHLLSVVVKQEIKEEECEREDFGQEYLIVVPKEEEVPELEPDPNLESSDDQTDHSSGTVSCEEEFTSVEVKIEEEEEYVTGPVDIKEECQDRDNEVTSPASPPLRCLDQSYAAILNTENGWTCLLDMEDRAFQRHLRLTREQFRLFVNQLTQNGKTDYRPIARVPEDKKAMMLLWYLANQNNFREISYLFDVGQGSTHGIIMEMLYRTCAIAERYIVWPNERERTVQADLFRRTCGLDGIVGAIGGCHVRTMRPHVDGEKYLNGKAYYSVLLRGIVDNRGRFTDIFAGPPGKGHDARMLMVSPFFNSWRQKLGHYQLLGNCVYKSDSFPFILTPKSDDDGSLSDDDLCTNVAIIRGRVVVDQALGRLKCQWRRLRELQNSRVEMVMKIIKAACVLYNMCIDNKCDEHPSGCPRQVDDDE